ncbi:hypothetical protein AMTR_s00120p00064580 [Amborella trichopoda]|uniref:Uncharacterized protein n=1 Tax=Amborella trichopoda TaxID=13333 RepID=W1NTT9_AMBTC|nr:hypothetical protein AMTR_s00120p00064580 [Amborella trichopoda]
MRAKGRVPGAPTMSEYHARWCLAMCFAKAQFKSKAWVMQSRVRSELGVTLLEVQCKRQCAPSQNSKQTRPKG